MKHYSYERWQQYVKDELSEHQREELEYHLYTCDQCLEVYLEAVTANETSLPALPNDNEFTNRIMEMVPDTDNNNRPWFQRAGFHYLLAAAATLFLMFSGVFQSVASYAGSLEKPIMEEKKPSVTEGVINKTFAWMDSLEKKEAKKK
ncbi:anti-sigma factor family protein [Neobacillus vireti]|uniref:anti-sigma factor family protein n=1 Tax=Neobacillus vireti TaxID=220686 RepID=UPI002FFFB475